MEKGSAEREAEKNTYSQILRNNVFCNWMAQGVSVSGNESLIIQFAKICENFGINNMQIFLIASKACKSMGDLDQEKIFLADADGVGDNWYISARLADICLNEGRLDDANIYIRRAMAFPYRQNWVVKLNDRIDAASS